MPDLKNRKCEEVKKVASTKQVIGQDTVTLVVSRNTLELIRLGELTLLPVYRSEWSLNKFIDSAGFEKKFRCIVFRAGNLAGADSVRCLYGGIIISGSDHYVRVGDNRVRVFQGDLIIKINEIIKE